MMDPPDYAEMQARLSLIGRAVLAIDEEELAAFIATAERAMSLGPVLDPTVWNRGHDALRTVITHARALAAFRHEIGKIG